MYAETKLLVIICVTVRDPWRPWRSNFGLLMGKNYHLALAFARLEKAKRKIDIFSHATLNEKEFLFNFTHLSPILYYISSGKGREKKKDAFVINLAIYYTFLFLK